MSDPAAAEAVAAELVAARRDGRALRGFPGAAPADMAEAYRIQDAAIARWSDDLVGWKIGFIAPDRRAPGEPDRLSVRSGAGAASASDGPPVEAGIFADGFAAVEAEFVVRLDAGSARPSGAVDRRRRWPVWTSSCWSASRWPAARSPTSTPSARR